MASYEQQLARSDELPPVPGVVAHLQAQVPTVEARVLYERFLWEMRRDRTPEQAIDRARFAASYAETLIGKTLPEAMADLDDQIARCPRRVAAGEHRSLDDDGRLIVLNMSDRPVEVAASELRLAYEQLAQPRGLTVVIDDQPPS